MDGKPKEKDLLTVAEVAHCLNMQESTIRQWIWLGQIEFIKIKNKSIRIPRSAVDQILAEGRRPAKAQR